MSDAIVVAAALAEEPYARWIGVSGARVESGRYPLARMHTHTIPLERAEHAIKLLAGEIPGEEAIHIALKA
jgi:hypothetical protein